MVRVSAVQGGLTPTTSVTAAIPFLHPTNESQQQGAQIQSAGGYYNRHLRTGSTPSIYIQRPLSQNELYRNQQLAVPVSSGRDSNENWSFSRRRHSLSQSPTTPSPELVLSPSRQLLYSSFDDPYPYSYYEDEPSPTRKTAVHTTRTMTGTPGIDAQQQQSASMYSNRNLTKVKSGSLPGHYSSGSINGGNAPYSRFPMHERLDSGYSGGSSPYQQTRPSSNLLQYTPSPVMSASISTVTPEPPREKESRKWNPFGGLFKRSKDKGERLSKSQISHPILNYSPNTPGKTNTGPYQQQALPVRIQFEASQRPPSADRMGLASSSDEAVLSSDPEQKQTFLRKLSRKKKKKSSSSSKLPADVVRGGAGDFLQVPGNKRNPVNRYSQPNLQSWETTKKFPSNTTSSTLVLSNAGNNSNNYSSSGSLSLSIEGSSSKSSKAAAKEAIKARAEVRRSSYLNESSSDDEREGSFKGSQSSLSLRNRKGASQTSRPNSLLVQRNQQSQQNGNDSLGIPSSPRWEARVVYTQETLEDDDKPVVLRLPKYASQRDDSTNNNYSVRTETIQSRDPEDDDNVEQVVVTAGLKVPLVRANDPVYANLKGRPPKTVGMRPAHSPTPPPPVPVRSNSNFYRPTSTPQIEYETGRPYYNYNYESSSHGHSPSPTMSSFKGKGIGYPPGSEKRPSPVPVATSSPVHTNASSFWKKKEQEVLQHSARGVSPLRPIGAPSPAFTQQPKRIRSADSSPLLLPKNPTSRGLNYTADSVSSLSSFTNETGSPSPRMTHHAKSPGSVSTGKMLFQQQQARNSGLGENRQDRTPTRFSSRNGTTSPNPSLPTNTSNINRINNNNNGQDPNNNKNNTNHSVIKSPGRNLEDALNELEDMYKSLRLSDEDLLDRAERRDLPTPHQELRNKEFAYFNFDNFNSSIMSSPIYSPSPPPSRYSPHHPHFGQVGSLESLTTTSGSDHSRRQQQQYRVRAPPMRRSAHPDKINDDMAKRKFDSSCKETPNCDPKELVSQAGSYLILSPVFSPSSSPIPPGDILAPIPMSSKEPDLVFDDVTVRNFQRANAVRVIPEPQPKFGIPLGPITAAANSDYLHAIPTEKFRPLYRHVKNPDLVKDDIAFRALRKDLGPDNQIPVSNKDWVPKLYTPLRNFDSSSQGQDEVDGEMKKKKLRAIRSLSANQSPVSNTTTSSPPFYSPLPYNQFGTENINRDSRSMTPAVVSIVGSGRDPRLSPCRVTNYMEPSWVQQIELDEDELKELKRSLSPSKLSQFELIPFLKSKDVNPKKKVARVISSSIPLTTGPRRPWTDIILESFEKERQVELERQNVEDLRQNGHANGLDDYFYEVNSQNHEDEDEDDEEFVDALASQIPSEATSPVRSYLQDMPVSVPHHVQRHWKPIPTSSDDKQQLPLLQGQKTRRGSWVAGTESDAKQLLTPSSEDPSSSGTAVGLLKRRSWSDFPRQQQPCSTEKLQFGAIPVPPPRRVKQINLEGFHSTDKDNAGSSSEIQPQRRPLYSLPGESSHQPNVESASALSSGDSKVKGKSEPLRRGTKGEQELEDWMDALVRQADTCGTTKATNTSQPCGARTGTFQLPGPSSSAKSVPSVASTPSESEEPVRRRKFDIKARYPIDDDDNFNFGRYRKRSTDSDNTAPLASQSQCAPTVKISPTPPPLQQHDHLPEYAISTSSGTSKVTDPIVSLIETINEKLVPSLEESIKNSEQRMSTHNLAVEGESHPDPSTGELDSETIPSTSTSKNKRQQEPRKPTPLPRQREELQQQHLQKDVSQKFEDDDKTKMPIPKRKDSTTSTSSSNSSGSSSQFKVPGNIETFGKTSASAFSPVTRRKADYTDSIRAKSFATAGPSKEGVERLPSTNDVKPAILKEVNDPKNVTVDTRPSSKKTAAKSESADNKRDSLSDAEGINALKKLLRKENSWQNVGNSKPKPTSESSFVTSGIKKCPSVDSATTAAPWATQPSFLQKYFKQPTSAITIGPTSQSGSEPNTSRLATEQSLTVVDVTTKPSKEAQEDNLDIDDKNNVLGLSVAQKANLFMKLEHDQRFSKWRQNSGDSPKPETGGSGSRSSSATRFSTQPVTNEEISMAMKAKSETSDNDNQYQQPVNSTRKLSKTVDDNNDSGPSVSSSKPSTMKTEPTCLSIKDRVQLFNRLSSTAPTKTVNSPLKPRTRCQFGSKDNSSSGLDSSYDNINTLASPKYRRRSSLSDASSIPHHQQQVPGQFQGSSAIPFTKHQQGDSSRNDKSKSLFLAHSWEPDYVSEDGEVSSGGQEVSEIISKSYDNSPMFRKKNWRSQIPQPNLSKEIWRKLDKQNPTFDTGAAPCGTGILKPKNAEEREMPSKYYYHRDAQTKPKNEPKSSNVQPSSSSLLPILKVLSSSDDQLDDYNTTNETTTGTTATDTKMATSIDSVSNQKDASKSKRKYLKMRSEVCVRVPHPDDESFQKFFPQQEEGLYDNVPLPPDDADAISGSGRQQVESGEQPQASNTSEAQNLGESYSAAASKSDEFTQSQLGSIKREGDLLTNMKRHIPILRRKSSGKSSKNPLKTLAARIDSSHKNETSDKDKDQHKDEDYSSKL